jgi:hypothetical protein
VHGQCKFHSVTSYESSEVEQWCSYVLSLTSALNKVGGQRLATAALPPGKTRYPGQRGWMGPRVDQDGVRKISPLTGFDPGQSSPWRVTIPTALSRPTMRMVASPLKMSVNYSIPDWYKIGLIAFEAEDFKSLYP